MNDYTTLLRNHNLKATPQRLAITNILYSHGHINIELLYQLMLQKFSSLSLATIYKNINLMLENSLIQEVKLPHTKSVYELTKEIHSHLLCTKCEIVEDITVNISNAIQEISQYTSFNIESSDLVLSGLCKKCQ